MQLAGRVVAVQAVRRLTWLLEDARGQLAWLALGTDASGGAGGAGEATGAVEALFRAVEACEELPAHLMSVAALQATHLVWLPDRIASVRYDLSDVGVSASPWVLELQGCLSALQAAADAEVAPLGGLPVGAEAAAEGAWLFWRAVVGVVSLTVTEGLSRVPRCTLEGRSRMMLDMQVLVAHLRSLLPPGCPLDVSLVDEYVQGFFLQVSEVATWLRSKRQYTRRQVVALLGLVAEQHGMRRRALRDLVAHVDPAAAELVV